MPSTAGHLPPSIEICRGSELALDSVVRDLVCHQACLPITASGKVLDEMFRERPELPGVIVTGGEGLTAIVSRHRWLEVLSLPFRAELYLEHAILRAFETFCSEWLTLQADTPVHEAAERSLSRRREALFDPIVVEDGQSLLILDAHVLMLAQVRIFALSRERSENLRHEVEQTLEDLRATQDKLVEARRLASLARMVAGMAHEINTPVGIALTAVTHLEDTVRQLAGAVSDGRLKRSSLDSFLSSANETAHLARSNIQRAAELVRSFKRVAVDETSEVRRSFNLAGYLSEVILSLRPMFKHCPCEVVLECPDDIVLDSYPGALAQVLSNLLANAVEHAFPAGRKGIIRIQCGQVDDRLELRFADDGQGIPEQAQVHLFEPFFTTRGNDGGSGLGLHIVYNLVNKVLRGSIECSSSVGKGTAFAIHIPLRPAT